MTNIYERWTRDGSLPAVLQVVFNEEGQTEVVLDNGMQMPFVDYLRYIGDIRNHLANQHLGG